MIAQSASCSDVKPISDTIGYTQSNKISLVPYVPAGTPKGFKGFLRMHEFGAERDIIFVIHLGVDNVKAIRIFDLNAEGNLCDVHYSTNVSFQLFEEPMTVSKIYTMIGTPCLHQRSARLKLVVKTDKEKYYRIHSFSIDPLASPK